MTTIKSTVNLNKHYKDQLEALVRMNMISSLTEGINDALEMYVKAMQKSMYAEQMRAASCDKDFMERTMSSQRDFDAVDTGEMFTEDEQW